MNSTRSVSFYYTTLYSCGNLLILLSRLDGSGKVWRIARSRDSKFGYCDHVHYKHSRPHGLNSHLERVVQPKPPKVQLSGSTNIKHPWNHHRRQQIARRISMTTGYSRMGRNRLNAALQDNRPTTTPQVWGSVESRHHNVNLNITVETGVLKCVYVVTPN